MAWVIIIGFFTIIKEAIFEIYYNYIKPLKVADYTYIALCFVGILSIFLLIHLIKKYRLHMDIKRTDILREQNKLLKEKEALYMMECMNEDRERSRKRREEQEERERPQREKMAKERAREREEQKNKEILAKQELERKAEREKQIRMNLSEAEKNKQEQEAIRLRMAEREQELELERIKASSKAAEAQIIATHQERVQQSDKELDKLLELAKSLGINKDG